MESASQQLIRFVIVYQLTVNCFAIIALEEFRSYRSLYWLVLAEFLSMGVGIFAITLGALVIDYYPMFFFEKIRLWFFSGIVCVLTQLFLWSLILKKEKNSLLLLFFCIAVVSWILVAALFGIS
ncbi:MAG TPA: hypothetical protein VHO47_04785 [Candidatus Babeliales bacterium]|nr:hypothetical protein [Candidatus Babeliales bacterium]